MSLEKQMKLLMKKKKELKVIKFIRNAGIAELLLTLPCYGMLMQDYLKATTNYTLEDLIKFSVAMVVALGATGIMEKEVNTYISDCAILKTFLEKSKKENVYETIDEDRSR